MSALNLLIDITRGPAPTNLANVYHDCTSEVAFHLLPDGVPCDRCNRDLNEHWWQVVAPTEQGGVLDCGLGA